MTELLKMCDPDTDGEQYIRIEDNEDKFPRAICSVFVGCDYDGGRIWLTHEQTQTLKDALEKLLKSLDAEPDLKPCPFCRKTPEIVYFDEDMCILPEYGERAEYGGVMCRTCNLTMTEQLIIQEDIREVIQRWNGRTIQ